MYLIRRICAIALFLMVMLPACQAAPAATPVVPIATTAPTHTPFAPQEMTATPANDSQHSDSQHSDSISGGYGYDANPQSPAQSSDHMAEVKNQAGFGSRFADGDLFIVSLDGVEQPPAGQTYQGWLLKDDGAPFGLGILPVSADGAIRYEWVSPNGENLLSTYRRFQITLETEQPAAAPKGKTFYFGGLEPEVWQTAQNLFVKNNREPVTPLNRALAPGFQTQLNVAIQHIHNAENAAQIGALAEMRNHMEHTINILEGAGGARFKDYTGDGAAQNPGDGFGARAYAREVVAVLGSPEAQAAGQKVDADITAIQDRCERIIALSGSDRQDMQQVTQELAGIEEILVQVNVNAAALVDLASHSIWFPIVADTGG